MVRAAAPAKGGGFFSSFQIARSLCVRACVSVCDAHALLGTYNHIIYLYLYITRARPSVHEALVVVDHRAPPAEREKEKGRRREGEGDGEERVRENSQGG
jgi:hypothetical protein